ncbi:MAG TPA: SusC/RagA family TonB-linked outer membrane protein, partial [Chitinophagaceae bacterium]|nr:SusC/RagA family TonB-linked outer membrane protein [Chitinophagaceae bacterium]
MGKKGLLNVLMTLLCACSLLGSFAQDRTISGIISDENGNLLSGATVAEKGGRARATTDANGAFRIAVAPGTTTLTVSYVGMQSQEVAINGRSSITVSLKVSDAKLNEVVVVGYGTRRRADVTTAISSVSEKDIKNLPVAGADQALQGKVAGVTVNSNGGQPGGGISVRVRGITQATGGNEPLYVIDGVPINATTSSLDQNVLGGGSGQTGQSVLATLNPSDIASIDILKDASAQAIYGSRAANGVVLIQTKRGRAGEGKITYDTYYGWARVPRKLDVMNLRQYATYLNSLVGEVRAAGDGMDSTGEFRDPSLLGHGTDWQDAIFQTGNTQNHQLSFSGGQGKTNYYFSGNYYDQSGTIINSGFKRYAVRMNLDHQVKSWLRAGISTNLSRTDQQISLTNGFDAITSVVLYNSPAAPIRTFDGGFSSTAAVGGINFGNPRNPVALATLRDVRSVQSKAVGAIYADLDLIKGLTLRNEVNYDFTLASNKAFQPYVTNDSLKSNPIILSPSRLREERNNSLYWAFKTYLNYTRSFGDHNIYATVGHEAQASRWDNLQASRDNLTLNLPSLAVGASGNNSGETIGAGAGNWRMESYFARVNYSFDRRYALEATIRRDGSSSFGANNRVGYFPAASLAWTLSNEGFMENLRPVSYLKLRLGAGAVGNQSIGANAYTTNIRLLTEGPFGGGGIPRNVGNPDLKWMSVITYNAGIDATL